MKLINLSLFTFIISSCVYTADLTSNRLAELPTWQHGVITADKAVTVLTIAKNNSSIAFEEVKSAFDLELAKQIKLLHIYNQSDTTNNVKFDYELNLKLSPNCTGGAGYTAEFKINTNQDQTKASQKISVLDKNQPCANQNLANQKILLKLLAQKAADRLGALLEPKDYIWQAQILNGQKYYLVRISAAHSYTHRQALKVYRRNLDNNTATKIAAAKVITLIDQDNILIKLDEAAQENVVMGGDYISVSDK